MEEMTKAILCVLGIRFCFNQRSKKLFNGLSPGYSLDFRPLGSLDEMIPIASRSSDSRRRRFANVINANILLGEENQSTG